MRWTMSLIIGLAIATIAQAAPSDLAIVSGKSSPAVEISREQAERLFLGRLDALPDGAVVNPVDLPPGPVRDQFYLHLTGKNPNQIRAYWSRLVFAGRAVPPKQAQSVAEVKSLVNKFNDLIGYIPISDVDNSVRVLLRIE
ncbi:MAG: hypothetical protein JNJ44_04345 [Zoogloeaceae bacterium]|nr:hypothetical protein [Zoogloeaceae bacterium]